MKGSSIEVEEIKLLKCRRKNRVGIINEETQRSSSEEEEIGIHKYMRRSLVDTIKKEVKGWTSLSKQQETPPEPTKTKEEIC